MLPSLALFLSLSNGDDDDDDRHASACSAPPKRVTLNTSCGVFKKGYKIKKAFDKKLTNTKKFWLLKWYFRVFGSAKKFPRKTMWLEKLRVPVL